MIRPSWPRLAALLLLGACGPKVVPVSYLTPGEPGILPDRIYPTEVEYQLLGLVTGEACGEVNRDPSAKELEARAAMLEPGLGDPVLYQAAKYDALTKVPDADNLTSIRVKVTQKDVQQCVTLTGRAYRITAMRSAPIPAQDGTTARWTPLTVLSPPAVGARASSRGRPEHAGQINLMVGLPIDGLPLYAGGGADFGIVGFDVGAWVDPFAFQLTPLAGLVLGYSFAEHYRPYVLARGGMGLGDEFGPAFELGGGVDVSFGHAGGRVEIATLRQLFGYPSLLVSAGPTFRF